MTTSNCPQCGSDAVLCERRPNGFTSCKDCGFKARHSEWSRAARHEPDEGATVLPYVGPRPLNSDALREIADDIDAGTVDSVALGVVYENGQVAHFHDWREESASIWSLLGAIDYVLHRIRRSIDEANDEW